MRQKEFEEFERKMKESPEYKKTLAYQNDQLREAWQNVVQYIKDEFRTPKPYILLILYFGIIFLLNYFKIIY